MRVLAALLSASLVAASPSLVAADIAPRAANPAHALRPRGVLAAMADSDECAARCEALDTLSVECTPGTGTNMNAECSAICEPTMWNQVADCVRCDMVASGADENQIRQTLAQISAVCGKAMPMSIGTLAPPEVTTAPAPPQSSASAAQTGSANLAPSAPAGAGPSGGNKVAPSDALTSPPAQPTVNPYNPHSGAVRAGAAVAMAAVAASLSLVFL